MGIVTGSTDNIAIGCQMSFIGINGELIPGRFKCNASRSLHHLDLFPGMKTEERDVFLSGTLLPCTENSIVDKHILEQELDRVREQNYATAHEEYEEGLSAIAAPVRDHTGWVVATVSISGPSYRMGSDQIGKFVEPLKETAHNISTQLGYVQPKSDSRER